ncbi:MAG: FHA domain-containing protein [Isosphaeraceae bacterium]
MKQKPISIRYQNLRHAYGMALSSAFGAVCGLYLYVELVKVNNLWVRDAAAGALIGGSIGFVVNAAGPFRDGAWLKLARAATWGTLAGSAGGAIGLLIGEGVLGGLKGGTLGRAVSWAILGLGIGASQGIADRSMQRLTFGLIGGGLGGFLGGFLFEQLRDRLGNRYDVSQGVGMVVLGLGLGLCLALVEQALRRAWVVVLQGRQEGRAYLLARRVSALGLDERAEVGLFGDPTIARRHAEIEQAGPGYVLHNHDAQGRTRVNGELLTGPQPLRDGDRIELGQTLLVFRQR